MLTLWQLPATQLAGLVRSRDVSARATVQATPDRLGDVNATINAVFQHSPTEELAAADAIESKLGVDDNTNQPKVISCQEGSDCESRGPW